MNKRTALFQSAVLAVGGLLLTAGCAAATSPLSYRPERANKKKGMVLTGSKLRRVSGLSSSPVIIYTRVRLRKDGQSHGFGGMFASVPAALIDDLETFNRVPVAEERVVPFLKGAEVLPEKEE